MTGTGVRHNDLSKKSFDPSFEHHRIYGRNLPIEKHIPNKLAVVFNCFLHYLFTKKNGTITRSMQRCTFFIPKNANFNAYLTCGNIGWLLKTTSVVTEFSYRQCYRRLNICFRIHKSFIIPVKIIDLICFHLLACTQILSNNFN